MIKQMRTLNYVILVGLLRKPKSGYDLTKWIERETNHFFAVGHSSIYPALSELERAGLVEHRVVPSEKGPKRKVYSVTEAGKEVLLEWANEPPAERQMRDEQLVKALCYPYMPKERVLVLLKEENARHEEKLALYRVYERELEELFRSGEISRELYLGTKLTLARGVGVEGSYVEWCEEAARTISSEGSERESGTR